MSQNIVNTNPSVAALGSSDSKLTQEAFQTSPIYKGDLTDEERTAFYQGVLDNDNADGGGYWELGGSWNPNFVDAPNVAADVEGGPGGKPANGYVPNVASPTEIGQDPSSLPVPPNENQTAADTPFVGDGTANPVDTSKQISDHKLGTYQLGSHLP